MFSQKVPFEPTVQPLSAAVLFISFLLLCFYFSYQIWLISHWSITCVLGLVYAYLMYKMVLLLRRFWYLRQFPGPSYQFPYGNFQEFKEYQNFGQSVLEMSKRYGSIFGLHLGPLDPVLMVTDTDFTKFCMVSHRQCFEISSRPDLQFTTGNSLLTSVGHTWQRHRKLLNPGFHYSKLRAMTPVFGRNVVPFLDVCADHARRGQPIDVSARLSHITLDIIGESAFGVNLGTQRPAGVVEQEYYNRTSSTTHAAPSDSSPPRSPSTHKVHPLAAPIENIFKSTAPMFDSVWETILPDGTAHLTPKIFTQLNYVRQIRNQVYDLIAKRLSEPKTGEPARDILDMLTRSELSHREMLNESLAFLFAGHETTSTLMSWLLFLLASNPQVDDKVYAELKQHEADILEGPSFACTRELKYLRYTIMETLRLCSPVPIVERIAQCDIKYKNYFIPRGQIIFFPWYAMHRSEALWGADAEEMRPERFADKLSHFDPDDASDMPAGNAMGSSHRLHPMAFSPFSQGPRQCIGQNFALLEATSVLSHILLKYRFTLCPQTDSSAWIRIVMRPLHGMMLAVHPR